jgi:hypothetical protein
VYNVESNSGHHLTQWANIIVHQVLDETFLTASQQNGIIFFYDKRRD